MSSTLLQFVPFSSVIESGFWNKLAENKLNVYKLDDSHKDLNGFYTNSDVDGLPCRHTVEYAAFDNSGKAPPLCFVSEGSLFNKNTEEDFNNSNKAALLENEAGLIWNSIVNRDAITNPSLLVRFVLLSFSDLKKFVFKYWFSFPAFVHSVPFTVDNHGSSHILSQVKDEKYIKKLQDCVDDFVHKHKHLPGFFLIAQCSGDTGAYPIGIHELKDFKSISNEGETVVFSFCDPSTLANYPGWPLRNYLTLIACHWAEQLHNTVNILCYRDRTRGGKRSIEHSLYLTVNVPSITERPTKFTGWEKNKKQKLKPRHVDLAENMDPTKLAESSVNLNLKLMRWRLMPALNLEKIAQTKCLLLGSGTLGCNIARGLLGWGVNTITMVDNGTVSFSNPVRQSLFNFSDCGVAGGRPKAIAAADQLTKIFPGVNSTGVQLSIPMPGHPVHSTKDLQDKVKSDVENLERLIDSHDVVFLLMDTRESRWLPTLLSSLKQKLVINAALGFDSYLVMRHGVISNNEKMMKPCASNNLHFVSKLGCYFCNDVVAPGNSMKDRTLDQQCTVTRPGVSMIASALAVELMAAVLHHPLGARSLPTSESATEQEGSCLGPVPHQIRGFLSNNSIFYPTTDAFTKCTGCSQLVMEAYRTRGFEFLLDVFNSPHSYLEDLTGLTELHQQTATADCGVLEFSDSDSI